MTVLVESLKRLYKDDKVSLDKIKSMLKEKKISQEEYDYIIKK